MSNNETYSRALHMAQCISALSIEVHTGLRHSRGSVLKLVQQRYNIKARTKAGALQELKAKYKELTGHEYATGRHVPESVD